MTWRHSVYFLDDKHRPQLISTVQGTADYINAVVIDVGEVCLNI